MRGVTRSPGALLASPVFVSSIGLLLLNDHVLKHAWPGLITGKLSDVAGVAMVAIGLTALLRRAAVAFALTALAFAALKTVPAAAVAAAPVLGGVTRTDPTDLIALAVLVPLWVWAHRKPHPIDGSRWMLPLRVAAVGAAVFATTATSCGDDGITRMVAAEGALFAADGSNVYRSDDGGRRWERIGDFDPDMDDAGALFDPDRPAVADRCVDGTCVALERVDRATRVVAERGGDVGILLVLTDADAAEIEAVVDEVGAVGCGIVELSDLAVVAAPDGLRISVAAGAAGILHRAPDGQWAWTAAGRWGMPASVAAAPPLDLPLLAFADDPTDWGVWVAALLPMAVLVVFVGVGALVVRLARRNDRSPRRVWTVVGVAGLAYVAVAGVAFAFTLDDRLFALAAVAWALFGGAVLAGVLVVLAAVNGRRPPGSALPPPQPRQRVG